MDAATAAGIAATTCFVTSTFPMLVRAARTHDLSSYSRGHLVLANIGNTAQAVYVLSLPPGPIWVLHAFHLLTTLQMLVWHLRHVPRQASVPRPPSALGRPELDGDVTGHQGQVSAPVVDPHAIGKQVRDPLVLVAELG